MAVPSNRSPSPLSSRRTYQSRTADSNSAPRRSFNGGNHFTRPPVLSNPRNLNPVTPANSPAGFGRKNAQGNLQGWDEKENENDQTPKPAESARSPANGCKNFMAPTISAASKFTPSPRKKVLVERNDPIRTSISLSDGKATFFSAISAEIAEDLDQKDGEGGTESSVSHVDQKDSVPEAPRLSKPSKRVTFYEGHSASDVTSGLKPETEGVESVGSVPRNTPPCLPVSPIIAPLDADPSLPPYDPKTNFLSPRPQFLHYKPNPRIDILLNKEEELEFETPKRLEDNFMLEVLAESFSDTDGTEASSSEDSQKDSDGSSSAENLFPEGMEEEELIVSEPLKTCNHIPPESVVEQKEGEKIASEQASHGISDGNLEQGEAINQHMSEGVVCDSGRPKSFFFKILKSVSLLLLLFVTGVSVYVTLSPSMNESILDTLKSTKLPDASEFGLSAKENFDQLGARFQKLSFDSISHLSMLINNKLGRGDNLGHVQFMNLTYLEDDDAVCKRLEYQQQQSLALEEDDLEEDDEEEEQSEAQDIEDHPEMVSYESDEGELEYLSEAAGSEEELATDLVMPGEISKSQSSEAYWHTEEASSDVDIEFKHQENSEDDYLALPSAAPEVVILQEKDFEADTEPKSASETVHSVEEEEDPRSEILQDSSCQILESPANGSSGHKEATNSVWGIASLVSALVLSAAAFIYGKRSISSNPNVVDHSDRLSGANVNPMSPAAEKMFQYRPASSHQNSATEVDSAEESFSSEMSSFRSRSSYSRKDLRGGGANEAQSQDRKSSRKYPRRESLASSSEFSTGSPSYGSFTTYERISGKNASADDEVLTPVRRSSRIRNQVTSP